MYVANHLATGYNKIDAVTELLDNLEFVMVPIVNPDGMVVSVNQGHIHSSLSL